MTERSAGRGGAVAAALLLAACSRALPAGPVEPVWDRTPCAECRMLISDPGFAAQLQTRGGGVLHFDDPGCLLRHEARERPELHAAWFHHHAAERWISREDVRFVRVESSPMGYGLGAVAAREAGSEALAVDEARAVVERTEAARGRDAR